MTDGVTFEQIRTGASHDLISLYEDIDGDPGARQSPFKYNNVTCDYYETEQLFLTLMIYTDCSHNSI